MTRRRSITTIATLALGSLALLLSGLSPATAATTGGVKGIVVSPEGTPLKGLRVDLMQTDSGDSYDSIAHTTTSASGSYSFSGFPASDAWAYRVQVKDPQGTFVSTFRSFDAEPGKTVYRKVTMKPAGSLTGKVSRADGAAPTSTRVHLIGPDVELGTPDQTILAYDDDRGVYADGTYRFVGLPAGDYTVRYTDTSDKYLDQCYDDVLAAQSADPTCDSAEVPAATVVHVAAGPATTLDDQQLTNVGAQIRGTVTDTAGHPLKGIFIAPTPPGGEPNFWYEYSQPTHTAGWFTRGPLPPGQYQLQAMDPGDVWATQWYDNTDQANAHVFDLGAGETASGFTIKLKSQAVIQATATPGTGSVTMVIAVNRKATGSKVSGQVTASWGAITKSAALTDGKATIKLTGIPAGRHWITVDYGGTSSTAPGSKVVTTTIK